MEFGIIMESSPGYTASLAAEIENLGFDILLCPDTQNLAPDPIGQLSLASKSTSKLHLGTGVTNPITRDVSVVACSMMTLHLESGGRAICGVGRGDSSTAHIGTKNCSTSKLKKFIVDFKNYVSGKEVTRNGKESRFRWLEDTITQPLTVDVACTGPKTIEMGVDVADRVSFAVGSAPEQLEWALSVAENRLKIIGRPRESIQLGAYVNIVCDPDEQNAINLGRMIARMVAHFAGMKDAPLNHLPEKLKSVAKKLRDGYDMAKHSQDSGNHLQLISDEFVDWFSICGSADKCVSRLRMLTDLGIEHVYQLGGSPVAQPHGERQVALVKQASLFANEVIPHFR
jgi:5,10-methylenetetrahydromethanopterin reductase